MATTNKKLTKKDKFTALLNMLGTIDPVNVVADGLTAGELCEFVAHEINLLDKKSGAEKKPTAQQTANEGIKTAIAEGMTENHLYTVTEIQKEIPECAELSNQRVSALLRQMIADGVIVRTEDKRKAYFSLA